MKRRFIIAFSGCLLAVFSSVLLHAQQQNPMAFNRHAIASVGTAAMMEEEPLLYKSYKNYIGVYVRAKVMRTFLRYFADAADVRWHLSDNRYFASFKNEGRLCKALFDYKGGLLYIIQYVGEKDLPKDVRRQLKSTYVDYRITAVSEVDANNVKSWVVNLQDGDNLIVVRLTDGALEELHHYKTHF